MFLNFLIHSRAEEIIVNNYMEHITKALLITTTREVSIALDKIANTFVIMIARAITANELDRLRIALRNALSDPIFEDLKPETKECFVKCLIVFKEQRNKLKLALTNLNWVVNKQTSADAFLSLEIEAEK